MPFAQIAMLAKNEVLMMMKLLLALALILEKQHNPESMTVFFSTYHSIAVINDAQKNFQMSVFDLVICDETHRTTGATFEGDNESAFVRIHNNDYVTANKRLYMTTIPRIYGLRILI